VLDGLTGVITTAPSVSVGTVIDNGANSVYVYNDGLTGDEPAMRDANGSYVRLRDINQVGASSSAADFVSFNGSTYFTADDGTNGREIWKVTGSGTPSIFTTDVSNENCCGSIVDNLVVSGSQMFFTAVSTVTRKELYVTDGTVAGTRLVKDINTDNGWCWWCNPHPDYLQPLNGKVIFRAGQNNDREVWVSDGTSAGTFRLADINANGNSDADQFAVLGDRVYFRARGTHGRHQLWSTDGTVAGTALVEDFNPNGNIEFSVGDSRGSGGLALLRVYDYGPYQWQWYSSNGTPAGTSVLDPYPTDGNWPDQVTFIGSNIFFAATDLANDRELYVIDQTGQMSRIANFNASGSAEPQAFTNIGGVLYFTQEDGSNGREMWSSDGTLAGTTLVSDVNRVPATTTTDQLRRAGTRAVYRYHNGEWELGVADPVSGAARIDLRVGGESNPVELTTVGSKVVFSADNGSERQLYVSDGTVAGTQVLLDINASGNDGVSNIVGLDGRAFFRANDGTNGTELWVTDGTVAGTRRLTNVNTAGDSNPTALYAYGNKIVISANDGSTGNEMYITTDGATFVSLGDNNPSGDFNPGTVTPLGSGFVFRGTDAVRGQEPWFTDGTAAGTRIIADLNPNGNTEMDTMVAISPTKVLFKGNDGTSGWEPWVTDGTANGTIILDIQTGVENGGSSDPVWITASNGRVYLNAYNENRGRELWVTDGTLAGTTQNDINLGGGRVEEAAAAAGSGAVWGAGDGINGRELWLSSGTAAGTVQIDLNPGRLRDQGNSYPGQFTRAGSTTYFVARNADDGNELWKTDGTVAGTQLVHDIASGTLGGNPDIHGLAGGRYVARSWSPEYGNELWVSDGTSGSSRLLKDIRVGTIDSNPDDFVMAGGRMFFRADDGVFGREMWVTDGTTAGTRMVKDIFRGAGDQGLDIDWAAGTGVVFRQNDGINGWQWFFTNGTAAGTRNLDNNPTAGNNPDYVTVVDNEIFYRLDDGTNGTELWAFNANTGSRRLVKDINPNGSSQIEEIRAANGRVYFWANDGTNGREIWTSDGTEAGTRMVKDINPTGDLSADYFAVVGNRMFFRAHNGTERNLWVTDGTTAGTYEVKNIVPNSDDHMDWVVGGSTKLFFKSWSQTHGWELWVSDGTEAGTRMVKDINPTGDVWMDALVTSGDRVFFRADDVVHGREAWTSDGTEAGTFMLADANTDPNSNGGHSDFDDWRVGAGGIFMFRAYNGVGREWWVSNGSVSGAQRLGPSTVCPNTTPDYPMISGSFAYVRACDPVTGHEVWVSDGTPAGTRLLSDINPGGSSSPENLTALPGGLLSFRANNGVDGSEMFVSGGTPASTVKVLESNLLGADSNPSNMTVVGNKLFFTADDGMHGRELWVTDSTGTRMVADPNPGDGDAGYLVAAGTSGVYYRYNDGVNGWELWYSDGTQAGTRLVKNLRPNTEGDQNGVAEVFGYVNGKVYFKAGNDSTGWEIGVSDGTTAGTTILDLRAGSSGSEPGSFKAAGTKAYLHVWSDTNTGRRIVSSDGTIAGTIDLLPASVSDPQPGDMIELSNQLAFVAHNGNTGRELWISDGTIAGTRILTAVNTSVSAEPANLYVVGSKLYFSAVGTTSGRELFVTTATPGSVQAIDINPSGSSLPAFLGNDGTNVYFSANDGTHGREIFVTAGSVATTAMADINLAGGSSPNWGVYNNSVLYFTAFDGASGSEYWALTGGWSAPTVPTVFRTANAPTAPTPVVRTVPATLPPSPSTTAPVSTTEAPFETVAPIGSTPPDNGGGSTTTTTTTSPTNTTPETTNPGSGPASNGPQMISAPTNATPNMSSSEQRQLEADRGEANAMMNGVMVPTDVGRVSGSGIVPYDNNRSPAVIQEIRTEARQLLDLFNGYLPAGESPRITLQDTPRGASFVGLLVDPSNPGVSIPVPAEFVVVITMPSGAMMMAGLNNSGNPSAVSTNGVLQVSRGGYIGISTTGMPQSTPGQLVVMSTPKVLGEFVTSPTGSFAGQAKVPTNLPTGGHSLVVKADWFAASFGFVVTLPVPVKLPATGANSHEHVRYAALFVLIGVAVLFARRRRITA
jgi:ELWxxDGT repeat protein